MLFVGLVLGIASIVMISTVPVRPVVAAVPVPQTLDIWADKDTYVNEELTGLNYGGAPELKAGYYTTMEFYFHRCILIQFDISLLPVDAVITSASLRLTLESGGGEELSVMRAGSAWDERTVTWSTRPSPVTVDPALPRTMNVGTTPLAQYSVDVTPWVEGWFSETIVNNGLWMQPEPYGTVGDACIFYSYEGAWVDPNPTTSALKHPKLRVGFSSTTVVEQPPPPDPPPWLDDYTPPAVELAIEPSEDISPGDEVTITVVATDNICLDQVVLTVDMVIVEEVLIDFDVLDATEETIEYTTTFDFGDHHIQAWAYDRMYLSDGEYVREHVGSCTPPSLTVSCGPAQVLPEDSSEITVTVAAEDPEGIVRLVVGLEAAVWDPARYPDHSEVFVFTEPYPKSLSVSVKFENLDVPVYVVPSINATRIEAVAQATDVEGLYSTARANISVMRPYQWDYGLAYANLGGDLCWQRYEDTFGHGELWGPWGLDWWKTVVARFWWPIYDMMATNGQCFGMSMYSLWHQRCGIPVPDTLTSHVGDNLPPPVPGYNEQSYAKRTIERWQGSQISQEILSQYIDQIGDELGASNAIRPFLAGPFQDLLQDLSNGRPGLLSIAEYRGLDEGVAECVGAHTMVPWRVVETSPDVWRIYVYDSNRPHASTVPSTDYENYDHYPYVQVSEDGFSYRIGGEEVWNDFIWYVSYEDVRRDDYDLMDGWLVAATVLIMIVVVATALAIAGAVLVTLSALLPIPLPLPMGGSAVQGIALPLGQPYDVEIRGQVDSEYSWAMAAGHSTYGIENKSCLNGSSDSLGLGLGQNQTGYSMRLVPGVADDDFGMGMSHPVGDEEREYLMENISIDEDGDMQAHATEDGDRLVIANRGPGAIDLKVTFRSNRSNGEATEDISVPAGKQVVITVDWDDLANSTVDVETQDIDDDGFPMYTVVIVIGLVVILAAAASIILLRRKRRE